MPPDSEQYYGLSYFALQLNELLEEEGGMLPSTDCRFRPDQRLLENGCVKEAESEKRRVEQVCLTNSLFCSSILTLSQVDQGLACTIIFKICCVCVHVCVRVHECVLHSLLVLLQ